MHRGIGRYSLALALAIVRNRGAHDVHIVVNSGFPDSAAALRNTFGKLLPPSAISSFITPLPAAEGNPDNRWRWLAAERIREHYLASLRPDVVHVSSLFEGFGDNSVNSVLHGDGSFDTAVTLYDLIPLLHKERYLDDPNISAWYYRKLESLKRAELLLAISASARDEAIAALDLEPQRVVNISSAADAIFVPRPLAPDARADLLARHGLQRPFIMYTGGIDYRKNIEGLIAAYAALPGDVRREYQLAVVCSIRDPDRVRLRRVAAKAGLAEADLVLTGFVTDDDLVSLYNCTALFVFPSLHEGFGLPVLEAMSCGVPVIGANNSSIPEVIGRADALFDPASVPAMTAAMARVLGDPGFSQVLRTHGLAQAKLFSWDASAQRALAAFEERHTLTRAVAVEVPVAALPKLRLALVVPDEASAGLADFYSADMIVVTPTTPDQLDAGAYDRIVYQIGKGAAAMGELLERHPGVVILTDFFLDNTPRACYLSHGYHALADQQTFPCNRAVLDRALGVIVHTSAMIALAQQWYGLDAIRDWRVVPADAPTLLHAAIEALMGDSQAARQQQLVRAIAAIDSATAQSDHVQAAAAIAGNRQRGGPRQLLVDITLMDANQAEQVRNLIAETAPGWRVEPVRHDGKRYRYARQFTLRVLGRGDVSLDDAVADASAGDILLGNDTTIFPPAWRACGVVRQNAL